MYSDLVNILMLHCCLELCARPLSGESSRNELDVNQIQYDDLVGLATAQDQQAVYQDLVIGAESRVYEKIKPRELPKPPRHADSSA